MPVSPLISNQGSVFGETSWISYLSSEVDAQSGTGALHILHRDDAWDHELR